MGFIILRNLRLRVDVRPTLRRLLLYFTLKIVSGLGYSRLLKCELPGLFGSLCAIFYGMLKFAFQVTILSRGRCLNSESRVVQKPYCTSLCNTWKRWLVCWLKHLLTFAYNNYCTHQYRLLDRKTKGGGQYKGYKGVGRVWKKMWGIDIKSINGGRAWVRNE